MEIQILSLPREGPESLPSGCLFFRFFFFLCWLGRGVLAAVGKKQTKMWNFSFLFFSFFGFSLSVAITPSTRLSARPMSFVDRLSHSLGRHHCRRLFLGIAFRRTRGNSHGSRSRDSAVPIPARRRSTYPLAIVRILKHKANTRGSSFRHLSQPRDVSRWWGYISSLFPILWRILRNIPFKIFFRCNRCRYTRCKYW